MAAVLTELHTIEQLRCARGLTATELARQAGVSINSIMRIERGSTSYATHESTAAALARVLGVSVNDIDWPRGLSMTGRPAQTGIPIGSLTRRTVPSVCPEHHIQRSVTGECPFC